MDKDLLQMVEERNMKVVALRYGIGLRGSSVLDALAVVLDGKLMEARLHYKLPYDSDGRRRAELALKPMPTYELRSCHSFRAPESVRAFLPGGLISKENATLLDQDFYAIRDELIEEFSKS